MQPKWFCTLSVSMPHVRGRIFSYNSVIFSFFRISWPNAVILNPLEVAPEGTSSPLIPYKKNPKFELFDSLRHFQGCSLRNCLLGVHPPFAAHQECLNHHGQKVVIANPWTTDLETRLLNGPSKVSTGSSSVKGGRRNTALLREVSYELSEIVVC